MSDAKAPKKTKDASKKVESAKPDAAKSDTSTADSAAKKAEPAAKSASQTSISHFSSVSTPQYRSGWDHIFGSGKKSRK